jgi:hypothetical protein
MQKKIISFSLWGDNEGYCKGAVVNARLAPRYYPEWTLRYYVDSAVPARFIAELRAEGAEIIPTADVASWDGLYWRFRPMYDDPGVERFIVRDTDSRLNAREAEAVREWEDSGLPFHIMRDNSSHNIEICGGMWGSMAGLIPEFKLLMQEWIGALVGDSSNPRGALHGTDQIFLCKEIWPRILYCHLAHDELHHYTGREQPYPCKLKRDGYVGMVYMTHEADRCELADDADPELKAKYEARGRCASIEYV